MEDVAGTLDDSLITIRWDADEGRLVYDIGDMDCYAAESMVRQVADFLFENLPVPRDINEPADEL